MGSDDFCLKWNDHHRLFFNSAESLCHAQQLTDVTLSCGDREFAAHKLVLSVCSDYFAGLFRTRRSLVDTRAAIVYLKDVDSRHMELLLSYMYRGEINVQEQELMELMATAKSLQIKGLADSNSGGGSGSGTEEATKTAKRVAPLLKNNTAGAAAASGNSSSAKALKRSMASSSDAGGSGSDAEEVKRIKAEDAGVTTASGVSSKSRTAGPSAADLGDGAGGELEEEDYEGLEGEDYGDEYGMDEGGAVPEGGGPMIYEGDEAGEANLSALPSSSSSFLLQRFRAPLPPSIAGGMVSPPGGGGIPGRRHQCPYCPHSSKHSNHLKEHIRTHTGERPFVCVRCTKSYTRRHSLNLHLRSSPECRAAMEREKVATTAATVATTEENAAN